MVVEWIVSEGACMLEVETDPGEAMGLLLFALFGLVEGGRANGGIHFSDAVEYIRLH